jgi:DNA-binding NtrC family response regulator
MEIYDFLGFRAVFASPASRALHERVQRLAQTSATVLIFGESGAGKEMVARALHHYSRRCAKPWVDVSCAALPEHLIESELFGYEKGAFSGADSPKPGLFELAHSGTLFLDEIGELPPKLQVKLLRVLDTGSFFRLGGTRRSTIDVRIVAASNRDLNLATGGGEFRKDLYHRLAQIIVEVPPLRQRPEDIAALATVFREQYAPGAEFHPAVVEAFIGYDWPGNIRELKNAIITASVNTEDGVIRLEHLPATLARAAPAPVAALDNLLALAGALHAGSAAGGEPAQDTENAAGGLLDRMERQVIQTVLERTGGHQEQSARILGISPRTLSRKLKAWRMDSSLETNR